MAPLMMSTLKVHILEGTHAGGDRVYRCGRIGKKGRMDLWVGCAVLDMHQGQVTCKRCLQRTTHPVPEVKR